MKKFNIQIYGRMDDRLPDGLNCGILFYDNELAVVENLKGAQLKESPDLCLEIHTRPYYAHLMPNGVPKAVYFCNFPGGYYHNEALIDLYDFVFYNSVYGENYKRSHSNACFLPPWMPDAYLNGGKVPNKTYRNAFLGVEGLPDWGEIANAGQIQEALQKFVSLGGHWYLGEPDQGRADLFLGVCFKAHAVYVSSDSTLKQPLRDIGAGLFEWHNGKLEILAESKEITVRQQKIKQKHLFRSRIEQIVSVCLPKYRSQDAAIGVGNEWRRLHYGNKNTRILQ